MPWTIASCKILRAIVTDYVDTREPVDEGLMSTPVERVAGHRACRHGGARGGGLHHAAPHERRPHPRSKGYRLFVDRIATVKPLSPAGSGVFLDVVEGAVEVDDIVQSAVRLLAQVTQLRSMQLPMVNRATIRHIELVKLTPSDCWCCASHRLVVSISAHARPGRRGEFERPPVNGLRFPVAAERIEDGALLAQHVGEELFVPSGKRFARRAALVELYWVKGCSGTAVPV